MNLQLETIIEFIEQNINRPLKTKSRSRDDAYVRSLYYTLAKKHTLFPLSSIGEMVGRDHTTVLHGLKLFDEAKNYHPLINKVYTAFNGGFIAAKEEDFSNEVKEVKKLIEQNENLKKKIIELTLQLKMQENNTIKEKPLEGIDEKLRYLISNVSDDKKEMLYTRLEAITKML